MTADASVYAPLTNAPYKAFAIKQPAVKPTKKPWRETPLVESANLSEAAGWYGADPLLASPPLRASIYINSLRITSYWPLLLSFDHIRWYQSDCREDTRIFLGISGCN